MNSVLNDPDKFNFMRPARQAWDNGKWIYSFEDGGQTKRVAASWAEAKKGNFVIVSGTKPGAAFNSEKATSCNFNITFCYHEAYGGPEGLARLVDAAHREDLGVVLDVVYNHVGPGNEALTAFGPFFTDRFGQTP